MKLSQKFLRIFTTLFFSGYSPIAPGTAGTAVVALLYVIFSGWIESFGFLPWLVVLSVCSVVAIYTSHLMSREWGKDPGRIVIDEGVGFLFTVAFLPVGRFSNFLKKRLLRWINPVSILNAAIW